MASTGVSLIKREDCCVRAAVWNSRFCTRGFVWHEHFYTGYAILLTIHIDSLI